jgi:D-hydroxyproline dehydrogenase subunit gamma
MPEIEAPTRSGRAGMTVSISIRVDGRDVQAVEGEALIGALHAAGLLTLRASPRGGTPRGAFCFMGACQECRIRVDGRLVLACRETARAGADVRLGDRP